MGNLHQVDDLIGFDDTDMPIVDRRQDYGIFHDVDDSSFLTVRRNRAAVSVSVTDCGFARASAYVNLSGMDAAKLSGALTAAAVDALTWEEQNR